VKEPEKRVKGPSRTEKKCIRKERKNYLAALHLSELKKKKAFDLLLIEKGLVWLKFCPMLARSMELVLNMLVVICIGIGLIPIVKFNVDDKSAEFSFDDFEDVSNHAYLI
jgi:hypothetical protein